MSWQLPVFFCKGRYRNPKLSAILPDIISQKKHCKIRPWSCVSRSRFYLANDRKVNTELLRWKSGSNAEGGVRAGVNKLAHNYARANWYRPTQTVACSNRVLPWYLFKRHSTAPRWRRHKFYYHPPPGRPPPSIFTASALGIIKSQPNPNFKAGLAGELLLYISTPSLQRNMLAGRGFHSHKTCAPTLE